MRRTAGSNISMLPRDDSILNIFFPNIVIFYSFTVFSSSDWINILEQFIIVKAKPLSFNASVIYPVISLGLLTLKVRDNVNDKIYTNIRLVQQ